MLKAANQKLAQAVSRAMRPAGSRSTRSSVLGDTVHGRCGAARRTARRSTRSTRSRPTAQAFAQGDRTCRPTIPGSRKPCARASSTSSSASRSKTSGSISRTVMERARTTKRMRHAASAAREVAAGMKAGTLPPFIGIRIKPMSRELHARSLRTLDIFVTTVVKTAKRLPDNFAVTLCKVMSPAHVTVVARACSTLERKLKLKRKCHSARVDDRDAAVNPGARRQRRPARARQGRAAAACAARTSASTTTPRCAASPRPGSIRATSPATWRGR